MMNQFCHLGPMIVMIVSIAVSILGTATIAINCYAMTMPKRWKARETLCTCSLKSWVNCQ